MSTIVRRSFVGSFVALIAMTSIAGSQAGPPSSGPHLIVVKLVEHPGQAMQFGFEPAAFTAHRGDTLRFVQAAATMHNVHIKKAPKGAKLGSAAVSDYLIAKGQSYTLVIDARFVEGVYQIVCDPHELIGMHATLTVAGSAAVASSGKQ